MSIVSLASAKSVWRGYEYFKAGKVLDFKKITPNKFEGIVSGSNGEQYSVLVDEVHPRMGSHCDCPHAAGRSIICKHMVALYFTAYPDEAEQYLSEIVLQQQAERQRQYEYDIVRQELTEAVAKLSKAELQQALVDLLMDASDWQYEQFIETYIDPRKVDEEDDDDPYWR